MKMTLQEHCKIAKFIGSRIAFYRQFCKEYAFDAVKETDDDKREDCIAYYKAYMLMLDALKQLCDEYDFDCVVDVSE